MAFMRPNCVPWRQTKILQLEVGSVKDFHTTELEITAGHEQMFGQI